MSKERPSGGKAKRTIASKPQKPVREVDGICFDREHLNRTLSALNAAGFSYTNYVKRDRGLELVHDVRRCCSVIGC